MIIEAFENKIFPMITTGFESDEDEIPRMSPDKDELSKQYDELYEAISNVDNKLDSALIRKYFNKGSLLELNFLRYSQSKVIDGAKQVLIKVNLFNLKLEIMSDDEINKKPDLIAYLVEKILDTVKKINNQEQLPNTTDMADIN